MRILLTVLIFLHGLIHLIGFSHAFKLTNFKLIAHPVSRIVGILWLLACLLFILAGMVHAIKNEFWWITGFIAIIVSQILILFFWENARFGTIPNLIILMECILAYASFNFIQKVDSEVFQMISGTETYNGEVISACEIEKLPVPVQNWLKNSGIIDKENVQNVFLKQEVLMKMKPGQKSWFRAEAEQYFTTQSPAFIWTVTLNMNPLIKVVGRDKFENGKGEMLIKILSFFPVVNTRKNEKLNQAALQRYLAEIVWFPSSALSPCITWESIDDYSAKARMSVNGTTDSGIFYFNENGDFTTFSAMRYKEVGEESEPKEWIVEALESKVVNGIKIPVKLKATWKLDEGDWTWIKLKITEINYNHPE